MATKQSNTKRETKLITCRTNHQHVVVGLSVLPLHTTNLGQEKPILSQQATPLKVNRRVEVCKELIETGVIRR
ncbi:predicted protein [Botrytis cinerea T4]|uniref:Uncharacterized protein n=1 Tax=Botryotinia fuckeliana (strain T4) TaxID=999810 RepID=G2Y9Y7_BOTF4|nr:predicted protein [Botrytis cinerea T4]